MSDSTGSLDSALAAAGLSPDLNIDAQPPAGDGLTCVVTVVAIEHDRLLQQYVRFNGETAGENLLGSQFFELFERARERAEVTTGIYRREPGLGRFTAAGARDAERLCQTFIEVVQED